MNSARHIPRNAALMGYSGVIPFAACAAALVLGLSDDEGRWLSAFLIYGAVILSFLGGIRWGSASVANRSSMATLLLAVVPSLWAAAMLWVSADLWALWGLLIGFSLMGLMDWVWPGIGLPSWMPVLRVRLTVAVVVCHLLVLMFY